MRDEHDSLWRDLDRVSRAIDGRQDPIPSLNQLLRNPEYDSIRHDPALQGYSIAVVGLGALIAFGAGALIAVVVALVLR